MAATSHRKIIIIVSVLVFCSVVQCHTTSTKNENSVEEGRTFAHHAMKRLAVLLPAFMFKLGIMFTMILVTMITSTKGLLVGTLLLALGIGHFIASRFSHAPAAVPAAHISLPHLHYAAGWPHSHAHLLDRSDNAPTTSTATGTYPASYAYAHQPAYGAWKQ